MRGYSLICLLIWFSLVSLRNAAPEFVPTPEIIKKFGYPVEEHQVVTEDGYILTMHRISYSSKSPEATNKPAVFLQHGLAGSSADWVLLGTQKSLAFLLADNGYDVWLGNSRGNTYSFNHTTFSRGSPEFWDFSWHESAVYDVPAEIDYILNITKQKNVFFVGMSLGNSVFFAFASERPEYNHKIRLMVAMAPVVFTNLSTSPAASSKLAAMGLRTLTSLGVNGYRRGSLNKFLTQKICDSKLLNAICTNMMYIITGYDAKQRNASIMSLVITYYPEGASIRTFVHFLQIRQAGKFQKYDYGVKTNMVKYKQREPPLYNLKAVTAPVAIMYTNNDPISEVENVFELRDILPNCVEVHKIDAPSFGHFAYLTGNDVRSLVNEPLVNMLKKY